MAVKKRAKIRINKPGKGNNSVHLGKKKILWVLLILFSVLLLLSLISYSRFDKASLTDLFSDLSKTFSSDPEFNKEHRYSQLAGNIWRSYFRFFYFFNTGDFFYYFPYTFFMWGIFLVGKISFQLSNLYL